MIVATVRSVVSHLVYHPLSFQNLKRCIRITEICIKERLILPNCTRIIVSYQDTIRNFRLRHICGAYDHGGSCRNLIVAVSALALGKSGLGPLTL